ncbi:MAG: ADP-ribosylglycohydrolase family protein, partial [Eubacteriales bacterium]|nr:ADP-ribosylglycohydrolase family protein [Eubacteriales bacterium]
MGYPAIPDFAYYANLLTEYSRLKHENGSKDVDKALQAAEDALRTALENLKNLPECPALAAKEPDDLAAIRALRPDGPRRLWKSIDPAVYADRLRAAFLGRIAGCTLGAPVEFWPVKEMEDWAAYIGQKFPPVEYWHAAKRPNDLRYQMSPFAAYTKDGMDGTPVDDDITYTQLGLLIMEDHGVDFTVEDVGEAWKKYLPYACTAEEVALNNLNAGVPAREAAIPDNPYVQWIGADIRSDPFGYAAPGWLEKAAEMAYHDAYVSHRRNGIYGEMYFSAVIAAAFATGDPMEALHLGLTEIPAECSLAKDIAWAFETAPAICDYKAARAAVDERFAGMSGVHTNLNACLTIFGIAMSKGSFTRCISELVAMGQDNDCTAATAGSILGAAYGMKAIDAHWYAKFNGKTLSYLKGIPEMGIDDILARFTR